jgi:hypothetical protein
LKRRSILTFAAALALCVAGQAWAKPNFSGNWKLNVAKSDFGPVPAPEKMDRSITHEDPSLKFTTVQVGQQGEVKSSMELKTDGSESVNKLRNMDVKSVAKWAGDVLTVNSKREVQGVEITQNETWTLSEDGKQLMINNKLSTPQGDFELKLVFDKK